MKGVFPAQNEPAVDASGRWSPGWYERFVKFVERLRPLDDIDFPHDATKADLLRNIITIAGTTYSFGTSDVGAYFRFTSATAVTVTIPLNATSPIPIEAQMDGVQAGAGKVTFAPAVGVTLNSYLNYKVLIGKGAPFSLVKVGTNEWDLVGSLGL